MVQNLQSSTQDTHTHTLLCFYVHPDKYISLWIFFSFFRENNTVKGNKPSVSVLFLSALSISINYYYLNKNRQ